MTLNRTHHMNGIRLNIPSWIAFWGVCVLLFSLPEASIAQEEPEQSDRDSRNLVFQIDPMLSLSGFDGFKLSFINRTSADRSWRVGATFNFGYEYRSFDIEPGRPAPDSRSYDLFVRIQYDRLYSIHSPNSISFYTGGGPRIGAGFYNENDDGVGIGYDEQSLLYDLGGGVVAGVEWRLVEMLSLYGEYGLNLMYFSHQTEITERELSGSVNEKYRTSGVELFGTGARVGVILRF
ncbi:MAG: hypothetical protein LAT84_12670 [Balneolia bacterium]|nr:hypothetical protein [Balneolia bacterium]